MIVLNNFWNKYYLHKSNKNGSQKCWVMTLKSSTKKGKQNVVADALSRKYEDVEEIICISNIQPDWINEARDEWKKDEGVWTLIQNLQQYPSTSDTFSWKNDSLWYKDFLYICKNS